MICEHCLEAGHYWMDWDEVDDETLHRLEGLCGLYSWCDARQVFDTRTGCECECHGKGEQLGIACKICIAQKGLSTNQLDSLFKTQDELNEHLEREHHMPVIREDETQEEAIERFRKMYPEVVECPECIMADAPWTRKE